MFAIFTAITPTRPSMAHRTPHDEVAKRRSRALILTGRHVRRRARCANEIRLPHIRDDADDREPRRRAVEGRRPTVTASSRRATRVAATCNSFRRSVAGVASPFRVRSGLTVSRYGRDPVFVSIRLNRRQHHLTIARVDQQFETADVAAILLTAARLLLRFGVPDRLLTCRARPWHVASPYGRWRG
jgi:hypothetical protein